MRFFRFAVLWLLLALAPPLAAPGLAAEPPPAPAGVTAEELEALVAALENEAERKRLLQHLRALIEARRGAAGEGVLDRIEDGLLAVISERVKTVTTSLSETAAFVSDMPRFGAWIEGQIADPVARARWIEILGKVAVVFLAALFANRAARVLVARPRRAVEDHDGGNVAMRAVLMVVRAVIDLIPVAAFLGIGYAVLPVLDPSRPARLLAVSLLNATALAGIVLAVLRILVVPRNGSLRILPVGEETANYIYIWLWRLTNVTVFGYFLVQAAPYLGMPRAGTDTLAKLIGLLVATLAVIVVLQNRTGVAQTIRGRPGAAPGGMQTLRDRLADVWHVLAILYIVGIYMIWVLRVNGGFEFILRATVATIVILALARAAVRLLTRLADRGFSVGADVKARFPTIEARANRYLPVLKVVLKAVVYVVAALGVLQAWGVETFGWLISDIGRRFTGSLVTIGLVLVVALVFWEMLSAAIERYLKQIDTTGKTVERSARARTLLPLLRNAVLVVLVVLVTLIVLSELGVNIAPLLAGAGVVGLAIGFGSQKLVQDIITGVFILFEDTISVGDIVRLDGHSGLVEAMTIRTIRLRDVSGAVHTVPFSAVGTVVNLTKEFSYYVMDVGVAYREDTDAVIAALKGIGAEMQAEPEYGALILEPLDVLGVDSFADSAVIIKARLKTVPTKQWFVGREFNRRMKKRFDELGIEMPFPHRTIYFGEDREGRAPAARLRIERSESPSGPAGDEVSA